jgi:hypothetical protein
MRKIVEAEGGNNYDLHWRKPKKKRTRDEERIKTFFSGGKKFFQCPRFFNG